MSAIVGAVRRPTTFTPDQAVFTVRQAVAFGIPSRAALYRLFNAGALTPRKLGGTTVISGDELRAFLRDLPIADVRIRHQAAA